MTSSAPVWDMTSKFEWDEHSSRSAPHTQQHLDGPTSRPVSPSCGTRMGTGAMRRHTRRTHTSDPPTGRPYICWIICPCHAVAHEEKLTTHLSLRCTCVGAGASRRKTQQAAHSPRLTKLRYLHRNTRCTRTSDLPKGRPCTCWIICPCHAVHEEVGAHDPSLPSLRLCWRWTYTRWIRADGSVPMARGHPRAEQTRWRLVEGLA